MQIQMNAQQRGELMRRSLEQYYDLIIEIEEDNNIPIYDQEKLDRFFSTTQVFTDYDVFYWYMAEHFVHPDDMEAIDIFREEDLARREKEGDFSIETEFRIRRDGGYIWISMVVILLYDDDGKLFYLLTLFKNINTRKCIELENTVLAHIDAMTGLYNKKYMEAMLRDRLGNDAEYGHSALVMIDIDNFKNVNDSYGHLIGDSVIVEIGKRILHHLKDNDFAGRIGGDEFLFYIGRVTSPEELEERIRSLHKELDFTERQDDTVVPIHCSIGAALYSRDNYDYLSLYRAADRVLYRAKARGKRTYELEWSHSFP